MESLMSRTLSVETIAIVKSTGPLLQQQGVAITTRMYQRLFENEAIRDMFDAAAQANGEQPRRLAAAILGYAQNIDKLENLAGTVERMVARHVETGVKAEHYPFVAEALLPAIRDVLGADVASDAVLAAWREAYWVLADLLIAAEKARYDTLEAGRVAAA
jgi:hemoglobin-like flavoprotein